MIFHLKVACDTVMKMRTEAILESKALTLAALRERLEAAGSKVAQVRYLGRTAPGAGSTTTASAKASLRAIVRRWLDFEAGIRAHNTCLPPPAAGAVSVEDACGGRHGERDCGRDARPCPCQPQSGFALRLPSPSYAKPARSGLEW
jgi:hypothetical protein